MQDSREAEITQVSRREAAQTRKTPAGYAGETGGETQKRGAREQIHEE